jgi:hypothetical protein
MVMFVMIMTTAKWVRLPVVGFGVILFKDET